MVVVVEGVDLPGRRCRPDPTGHVSENIHVGLCSRRPSPADLTVVPPRPWTATELAPGDADSARWEVEVTVRQRDGQLDFGGPSVRGNHGDRHIGLAWGELPGDGTFRLFRGAKLRLDRIDPTVVEQANRPGMRLVARLGLTDKNGNPRCATVRPEDITWSAMPVGG